MLQNFLAVWYREIEGDKVYSYRTIRLFVGVIAFSLPVLVIMFSGEPELKSISASYYTEARNTFVGFLFVVGAFLVSYRGHYTYESVVSIIAGLAAFIVATAPTACKFIEPSQMCEGVNKAIHKEDLHTAAAIIMFGSLAYFCLFPFRRKADKDYKRNVAKGKGGYALARKWTYIICGSIMILSMIGYVIFKDHYDRALFYAEWIMLWAFGIAWMMAGRIGNRLINKS